MDLVQQALCSDLQSALVWWHEQDSWRGSASGAADTLQCSSCQMVRQRSSAQCRQHIASWNDGKAAHGVSVDFIFLSESCQMLRQQLWWLCEFRWSMSRCRVLYACLEKVVRIESQVRVMRCTFVIARFLTCVSDRLNLLPSSGGVGTRCLGPSGFKSQHCC